MSTGTELRKRFGLEQIGRVMLGQVLTTPVRTMLIVFDSFRPDWPLTDNFLRNFPYPAMAFSAHWDDRPKALPFVEIDDYRGSLGNKVIVLIDLAGRKADEDIFQKQFEQVVIPSRSKLEEDGFTIPDFRTNGISSRNRNFLQQRKSEGKSGSTLTSVTFNKRKNTLLLQYKSVPTFDSKVGVTTKNWNAGQTGAYKDPPYAKTARSYKIQVLFEDVEKHVGTREDFVSLTDFEQEEFIRALIRDCPVRIHSNDKSFYFQGVWENGDELGFSLHPFPGSSGTGEWSSEHVGEDPGIYVTKHILEVFEEIENDIPSIVSKINRKYR